jgi:hypothetical protein
MFIAGAMVRSRDHWGFVAVENVDRDRWGMAFSPTPLYAGQGSELHHIVDGGRSDLSDDLSLVRAPKQDYRSEPIHDAGQYGHLECVRPHTDRSKAFSAYPQNDACVG